MRKNSINQLKSELLLNFGTSKFDVCVDLTDHSGFGHYSRIEQFLEKFRVRVSRWFLYPKDNHIHLQLPKKDKMLLLDSFILTNKKLLSLTKIYRKVILIDDGPLRLNHPRIIKLNWEPGRHLQKRFHRKLNCFCDFSLYPYDHKKVQFIDKSLFCYFSNDDPALIQQTINSIDLEEFERIVVVGRGVESLNIPKTLVYRSLTNKQFDSLLQSVETVLVSGGNTFYKALKLKKKIILYVNENKYLNWERKLARERGFEIIDGRRF